jgi:hypothetical protein
MPETDERDEVVVSGEVYRIARTATAEGVRITVSSQDQLRFSLPLDTPDEQVKRFIQVYALGFVDGQSTKAAWHGTPHPRTPHPGRAPARPSGRQAEGRPIVRPASWSGCRPSSRS